MNIHKSKNSLSNTFLLVLIAITLAFSCNTTQAQDYSNNIGFMKNPPKELKEKFPMCDQFLDVKWIRQFPNGGCVGTVTADVYLGDKKAQRELVVMQRQELHYPPASVDKKRLTSFDVSKSAYRGKALEELISRADIVASSYVRKEGHDTFTLGFAVMKDNKLIQVTGRDRGERTLQSSQNICVTLPKQEAAWIRERRLPFLIESRMTTVERTKYRQLADMIKKDCARLSQEEGEGWNVNEYCRSPEDKARNYSVYDFDGNGIDDYGFSGRVSFLNDNKPFSMTFKSSCEDTFIYGYLEPYGDLRSKQCVAEEKRKYLNRHQIKR